MLQCNKATPNKAQKMLHQDLVEAGQRTLRSADLQTCVIPREGSHASSPRKARDGPVTQAGSSIRVALDMQYITSITLTLRRMTFKRLAGRQSPSAHTLAIPV
jgi:hypothetical protein